MTSGRGRRPLGDGSNVGNIGTLPVIMRLHKAAAARDPARQEYYVKAAPG